MTSMDDAGHEWTGPRAKAQGSRHHYVPQFLLRRFATPDDPYRLWRLDLKTGKPSRCHTKEAAWVKDYYRFKDETLEDLPVDAESTLQMTEDIAAPLIRAMVDTGSSPSPDDRQLLGLFFSLLASRGPLGQGRIEATLQQTQRTLARVRLESPESYLALAREAGETVSDEEIERDRVFWLERLTRDELEFAFTSDHILGLMFSTALSMAPRIARFGWLLANAPVRQEFITSDTPLTHHDPTPGRPTAGSAWSTSDEAMTFIPLDPRHVLVISPGAPAWSQREVDPDDVELINLTTYAWAGRWIFGASQGAVQTIRGMAKRHPNRVAMLGYKPGNLVLLEDDQNGGDVGTATVDPLKPKRRRR